MAEKQAGKRVSKAAIDDIVIGELGWKRMKDLYPGRELPAYLKRLEGTGITERYLDPAAAKEIVGIFKFSDNPVAWEGLSKAMYRSLALFRTNKTVLNPATHSRNFLSNVIFSSFATGSLKFFPRAGAMAIKNRSEMYMKAVRAGVTEGSDHNITMEMLEKAGVNLNDANPYKFATLGNSRVGNAIAKGHDLAANVYKWEDEAWKVDAFISRHKAYMKAGMRDDQAISRAALDVAKFMPSFNQASPWTKLVGGVVPFSSFTNEAIRIWKNSMIEKPHMAFFWQHFAGGMTEAVGAAQGYSQEELERIKSALPQHQKNKPGMLLPWKIDGQPHFFDMSYIIPLAGNMGEMQNAEKSFFFSEFYDITGNPLVGLGTIATTGTDPFTQKPVEPRFAERQLGVNIESAGARKWVGLGEWMLGTMSPPLVPPGFASQNILELARGQVDPITAQPLEPSVGRTIAANLFGLRTYEATLSSAVLNSRLDATRIQEEITHQWAIHSRATANGQTADQEDALANLSDLKSKLESDPAKVRDYLAKGIERRAPGKGRMIPTKQLQESLALTEGLELSPDQRRIRGEYGARLQERRMKKKGSRGRKARGGKKRER
jgi:hypothetical protein